MADLTAAAAAAAAVSHGPQTLHHSPRLFKAIQREIEIEAERERERTDFILEFFSRDTQARKKVVFAVVAVLLLLLVYRIYSGCDRYTNHSMAKIA